MPICASAYANKYADIFETRKKVYNAANKILKMLTIVSVKK